MTDATFAIAVDDGDVPHRQTIRFSGAVWLSFAWLGLVILAAAFGTSLLHLDANATDVSHSYLAPDMRHWLGTDDLGRDELARVFMGGRISLSVGLVAAIVAVFMGTVYGAISGYYGGVIDNVLMRVVDVLLAVPTLFLLIFLAAMFHGSVLMLMLVIGVTSWLGPARLVRAEVLSIKERLYVEAAKSLGANDLRVIFRHVVPNAGGTIVTTTTFMIASAMLAETALSYLGIGIQPPTPSWGNLLSSAQSYIFAGAWWLIFPPGIAILATVCAFNFVGDWIREGEEQR